MPNLADFLSKGFVLEKGQLVRPSRPPKAEGVGKVTESFEKTPISPLGIPKGHADRLVLPYPISVNRLYGFNSKTGRRFMQAEGKAYCEAVKVHCSRLCLKPLEGDVVFSVWAYRPSRKPDLSNCFKVLEDVLQGILYLNDRQISEHHGYRLLDPSNPRVEVVVHPAAVS